MLSYVLAGRDAITHARDHKFQSRYTHPVDDRKGIWSLKGKQRHITTRVPWTLTQVHPSPIGL